MQSRYRMNRLKPVLLMASLACLSANACEGPAPVEFDRLSPTTGEEYSFDIYMLSEWAGRIVPRKDYLKISAVDLSFSPQEDANASISKDGVRLDSVLSVCSEARWVPLNSEESENGGESGDNGNGESSGESGDNGNGESSGESGDNGESGGEESGGTEPPAAQAPSEYGNKPDCLRFYPYGKEKKVDGEKIYYNCKLENGFYRCETYRSGAANILNIWDSTEFFNRKKSKTQSIVIGSGDNFGLSLPVSSAFDEIPTLQMLKLLGMDADTLGNHSFDYSLDELQHIIQSASYPFVVSNLSNLPNNLEKTTASTIIPIKSDDGNSTLHVAVVGVLDPNMLATVARGKLGTLSVSDFCPMINELEDAYNKNARAFIILSHVYSDSHAIRKLFNTIFSLNEGFDNSLRDAGDEPEMDAKLPERCVSHLLVTDDILRAYGEKDAAVVRKRMRQEILNNIVMVFGDANDNAFLTPLIPGVSESALPDCGSSISAPQSKSVDEYVYAVNGCDSSNETEIVNYFINNSVLVPNEDREKALRTVGNIFSAAYKPEDELVKEHPVWLAEFPSRGYYTAKASIKLTRKEESVELDSLSSDYDARLLQYTIEPVYSKIYNSKNYTDEKCNEMLEDGKCANYYNSYKDYIKKSNIYDEKYSEYSQEFKKLIDFQEQVNEYNELKKQYDEQVEFTKQLGMQAPEKPEALNEQPDTPEIPDEYESLKDWESAQNAAMSKLQDYKKSASQSRSDANSERDECVGSVVKNYTSENIEDAQNIWMCMYNVTQFDYDENKEEYTLGNLCKFDYTIEGENKDNEIRKYSTFSANFVSEVVLRYIKSNSNDCSKAEVFLQNAGSIRELSDFDEIDNEIVNTLLPYENDAIMVSVETDKLVEALEESLDSNVSGAFPVMAGMYISLEPGEKKKYQVRELWLDNLNEDDPHFTLVYISKRFNSALENRSDTDNRCVLGLKGKDEKCVIGKMKLNGNSYFYESKLSSENKAFMYKEGSTAVPLDPNKDKINVILNSYMYGGGDNFLITKDNYSSVACNSQITGSFKQALTKDKQTQDSQLCELSLSNTDYSLTSDQLVYRSLLKRIYFVDQDVGIDNKNFDVDYSYNPCVATQKALSEFMVNPPPCKYNESSR